MAGQLRQLLRLKTFRSYLVDQGAYRLGQPVCPCCASPIRIHPNSYVCTNGFCEQPTGHILDWLVREKRWKPEKAVAYMLKQYGEDGIDLSGPDDMIRLLVEMQWTQENDLLDWLHRTQREPALRKRPANIQAVSLLRKWGLEEQDWTNYVWPTDSESLGKLQTICEDLGFDTQPLVGSDGWLVFPFFATPTRVAELAIMNVWEKSVISWKRQTARVAWAGLLRCNPEQTPVVLENPLEAIAWSKASSAMGFQRECLAVRVYRDFPEQPAWPDKLTWVQTKLGSITTASRLSKFFPVSVSYGDPYDRDLDPQPLDNLLDREFEELALGAGDSPQPLVRFLQEIQPSQDKIRQWQEHTQRAELPDAERILVRFSAKKVIHSSDNLEIVQTEDGYYATKSREDDPIMVTNCCVSLKETVIFRQVGVHRVTHSGKLEFGRRTYDFVCESEDLQDPRRFEQACRNAEELDPQRRRDDLLPSVVDRSLCRHVLLYLRKQAATLPKNQGLLHLGWNEEGLHYELPFGRVKTGQLDIRQRRGDTSNAFFRLFNLATSALENPVIGKLNVPDGVLRLFACCCALVVRSRFRRPVQPIPVLNNEAARQTIPQLWAALGQDKPYLLNANERVGSDKIPSYGFPVYAQGPHTLHVLRGSQSFVVIGELGIPIEKLDPLVLTELGPLFRKLLIETAKLALEDQGLPEAKGDGPVLKKMLEEGLILLSILSEDFSLTDRTHELSANFSYTV